MIAPVTVVVPAHVTGPDSEADLRRCLESVARHSAPETLGELLVIDDASPYGDVAAVVGATPGIEEVTVVHRRHDENEGFVATANEGFASTDRDVVLLNSDTIVTAGWLDSLVAVSRADERVATVTPLTNAGSICTLPEPIRSAFGLDGDDPEIDRCAALVREVSLHLQPEVISGVGFCLLVTRRALDRCGPFDVEAFGRGYGEEVDFSLRASRHGLTHRVDDATFVFHRQGGSFGADREAAMARASALLHDRYPGFRARNRRERANDPLAPVFANLEVALHPRVAGRPHVLHVLHEPSRYGGTERHLDALVEALDDQVDTSIVHPSHEGYVLVSRWRAEDGSDHEQRLLLAPRPPRPDDPEPDRAPADDSASAVETVLDLYDVTAVHVHNLIGHPTDTLHRLTTFAGPVVCSVHDLYLACPNHPLLYRGESPCGIPDDLSVCARCLPVTRGLDRHDLEEHRATVGASIDRVDRWVTFSQSAADYLLKAYPVPPERLEIIPHGSLTTPPPPPPVDERHLLEDPLAVAFVGRAWAKKGLDLVNRAAARLVGVETVRLHHFGEVREALGPGVVGHGAYDHRELPALLHEHGIGVVLIPGPYAETFGLVMTEALQAGIPVIGPYYGAIAERIRAHDCGWVVDPDDPDDLPRLLGNLDRCRLEVLRATARAREVVTAPVRATAARYARLYAPDEPGDPAPPDTTEARHA